LSDGLSFEIFQKVKIETPVIFLTAYDQYAIRAFKLNSIDYLLKPLNIQELKSALIKFRKQLVQKSQGDEFVKLIDLLQHKEPSYRKRFVVYVAEKIKYIETENVAYFFIIEGETFFRDFEGNNYPCDFSLDKLASELDPAIFFRVNRQYTINLKAIKHMYNLTKSSIKIDLNPRPDEEVFVSLSRSGDFKRWLNQ
jgi:DNA-binding LytR/AlgR family response regulator